MQGVRPSYRTAVYMCLATCTSQPRSHYGAELQWKLHASIFGASIEITDCPGIRPDLALNQQYIFRSGRTPYNFSSETLLLQNPIYAYACM
jgi:hypothetical protein